MGFASKDFTATWSSLMGAPEFTGQKRGHRDSNLMCVVSDGLEKEFIVSDVA
jgi:hypothetical protein